MTSGKKPLFISFEGGDGCGKSTQSQMLYEYLRSLNIDAIHTREVGGTKDAEKIREVLLSSNLLPTSDLLLVMAARYEHLHRKIIPALQKSIWVVCDRFVDSTAVYQNPYLPIDAKNVYEMHQQHIGNIMPDITFFIDLPPHMAFQRIQERKENNKFDLQGLEFHQQIYYRYKTLAEMFKDRIVTIEAKNLTKEQIHQQIISKLSV